jgi:glycosyltransferase involved in cell wall biosynthesis
MKLVIVGPYPLDTSKVTGGVEAVLLYLLQGLKKINELEIQIISCNINVKKPKTIITDGIQVHYLPSSKFLGNMTLYAKNRYIIRKKIKSIKPDIVHFQDNFAYIGSKPFCPIITTLHGIQHREILFEKKDIVGRIRGLLRLFFERLILQKNQNIISINPYVGQEIQKRSPAKLYMISNPVDEKFLKITNKEIPNRILCLAPIYKLKNVIDLIKAIELLKEDIPDVELHIGGHVKSPDYFKEMIKYINEHNLEENVKYLGHLSEDKVLKEYEECCILAHSSLQEISPMVIQQAMAAGKPVVATNVGGVPYLVKDGITGFLVQINNINELANKIKIILKNNQIRKKFGKAARQEAIKNFKSDVIAKLTYDVYQKLLN